METGQTYSLIPADSPLPDKLDFHVGGIAVLDDSIDELCHMVRRVVNGHDHFLALFENRCSRIDDAYVQRARSPVIALGDEVFHYWHSTGSPQQLRSAVIESGTGLYTGGFVF
jgi:hypothetical protein